MKVKRIFAYESEGEIFFPKGKSEDSRVEAKICEAPAGASWRSDLKKSCPERCLECKRIGKWRNG